MSGQIKFSRLRQICALFALFFLAPALGAAETALSNQQIENLINSGRALAELENKYHLPEQDQPPAEKGKRIGPMTHALNNIKGHEAYGDFLAIIKRAGFSSAEEWANVGDRVMNAYIALSISSEEQTDVKSRMDEALKQLEDNPYISPEQKQLMIAQIKNSLPALAREKYSSPEDMKVVGPYLKRLEKAFE